MYGFAKKCTKNSPPAYKAQHAESLQTFDTVMTDREDKQTGQRYGLPLSTLIKKRIN